MALAFGGIISRIAITHLEEKSVKVVKHLDKEYLRRYLMDTDAIARSRRSDEVVVFGKITKARELPIKILRNAKDFSVQDLKSQNWYAK